MAEGFWLFVVLGGPILLGLIFIYGIYRRRQLTRREAEQRERVTHQHYEELKND